MSAGLLLLNSSLGAVTTLGGINAAICLGGLLSAAGGDELRSSNCWLLLPRLLLAAAGGGGYELRSSTCWLVCPLPLKRASCTGSSKRVASCLLLLKPTAKCLGLGHSGHCGFRTASPRQG
jgi:hypothetical protein